MSHFGVLVQALRRPGSVVAGLVLVAAGLAGVAPGLDAAAAAASAAPTTLRAGQELLAGQSLQTAGNQFHLVMQTGGDLVLSTYETILWQSNTHTPGSRVVMQDAGNLVVYSPSGRALWSNGTAGHPDAHLSIQASGNVVVWSTSGQGLWQTSTGIGRLVATQELQPNWSVDSPSNLFQLVMQSDGNLVEYVVQDGTRDPLWATMTGQAGSVAIMRGNGDLEVVSPTGRALWASRTSRPGSRMSIENNADMVVYSGTKPMWVSRSATVRSDIVAAAASRLGYQDAPSGTYCNTFTAYWRMGDDCSNANRQEAWCADFAAWAWRSGGVSFGFGYAAGDLSPGAASFARWAVDHGTWHPASSGYTPQPGDAVVYGLDASGSYADHVGIVVAGPAGHPTVINGDWWSATDGGVASQADETTASGSDSISGYASPTRAGTLVVAAAATAAPLAEAAAPAATLARSAAPMATTAPAAPVVDGIYTDGPDGTTHYVLSASVAAAGPATSEVTGSISLLAASGAARPVLTYRTVVTAGRAATLTTGSAGNHPLRVAAGVVTLEGCSSYLATSDCTFSYHGHIP